MSFDSWLEEMINRAKTVEKQCGSKGVNPKVMELLLDRSIEPYGLWKGNDTAKNAAPVNPEEAKNKLEAIKRKFRLIEDKGCLKINTDKNGFPNNQEFQSCNSNLKELGFVYDKTIHGFRKEVH